MGATLTYAKVVDREQFLRSGGQVRPGLDSIVRVTGEPPVGAEPFYIIRRWDAFDGAFTETWRIEDPHGRTLREGIPREVMPEVNDLTDEIDDLRVEYADEGYQLVLEVDGREVGRAGFPVVEDQPEAEAS
jgi:hypothetical protein